MTAGFDRPMRQEDADIESLKWTTKKKQVGSWEHFWNHYGINAIRKSEFQALMAGRDCQLVLPEATANELPVEVVLTAHYFKVRLMTVVKTGASNEPRTNLRLVGELIFRKCSRKRLRLVNLVK